MTTDEAYAKGVEDQKASEEGLFMQNDIPRFKNKALQEAYSRSWNDSTEKGFLARAGAPRVLGTVAR